MSNNWEEKFRGWASPPSQSEQTRSDSTIAAIREAIDSSAKLNMREITVIGQGSYRNNTNVKRDSDVDVGVICYDSFFTDYPEGTSDATFGISPATYHYAQFKNEVGEALVAHFGPGVVTRGNKAFDIKARLTGIEADVAPFFEHRRYRVSGKYLSGVQLFPDNGKPPNVINWPEQHYDNGVKKNNETGRRYKALVRVLKSLRNEMQDKNIAVPNSILGFLIECLIWNVPNEMLGNDTYYEDLKQAITHLWNATKTDQSCKEWGEVSELKYLFNGQQKWTRQQANDFLLAAWQYVGFKS